MNRKQLRAQAGRLLAWQPSDKDTKALSDANDAINMALQDFASETPFALVPDTLTVEVLREVSNATASTTLTRTTDPWVFITGLGVTDDAIPSRGTYDGQELEVGEGEAVQRFQIRKVWRHDTLAFTYISVERPCRTVYSAAPFRIRQTTIPFPDDVVQVHEGRRYRVGGGPVLVKPYSEQNALLSPDVFRAPGRVSTLARGQHFQVPAPTRPPEVGTMDDPNVWVGKEPPGAFVYWYTVGYGWRSAADGTPNGFRQVLWESSPSPPSVEVVAPSNGSAAIKVSLPNIAWPVNFDPSPSSLRTGKSGLYKLVYRARKSVTGNPTNYRTQIEYPDVPQLIAIVEDIETAWVDNGSVIPDPARRMPHSTGYYRYHPDCPSNEDDRFDFRVTRTPRPLETDYDAVPVVARAHPALLDLVAYRLSLGLGRSLEAGQAAFGRWQIAIPKLRAALQGEADVVMPQMFQSCVGPLWEYGRTDWRTPIERG